MQRLTIDCQPYLMLFLNILEDMYFILEPLMNYKSFCVLLIIKFPEKNVFNDYYLTIILYLII